MFNYFLGFVTGVALMVLNEDAYMWVWQTFDVWRYVD